jgi:hypothetical protein
MRTLLFIGVFMNNATCYHLRVDRVSTSTHRSSFSGPREKKSETKCKWTSAYQYDRNCRIFNGEGQFLVPFWVGAPFYHPCLQLLRDKKNSRNSAAQVK